jgi:predicted metal-binding protein
MKRSDRLESLAREAITRGASRAKIISAGKVVVDARASFKCLVPLCSCYGTHLLCPPNVISPIEFQRILDLYSNALIIQVKADFDSMDKSTRSLSRELCEELEGKTGSIRWQRKLHRLVNDMEASAFKKGFRFAAGLIGGECRLCEECSALANNRHCEHPFRARPSMEAIGIDVIKTCENAGLRIDLSSRRHVMWTGLVLLD